MQQLIDSYLDCILGIGTIVLEIAARFVCAHLRSDPAVLHVDALRELVWRR